MPAGGLLGTFLEMKWGQCR